MLAGMSDVDYQVETGLVCHSGGKEEYVWNTGDLRYLLALPCSVIEINGKLQQLNPGWTTKGPDDSEMKVWVTQPDKES